MSRSRRRNIGRMRLSRPLIAPLLSLVLIAGIAPAFGATPRKGQLCAKADIGKTGPDASGTALTCATDAGGKNRWTLGAVAVATVAATKATKATKATLGTVATTKRTIGTVATTKRTIGTVVTTKSKTATTVRVAAPGAAKVAVRGQFCKVADDGKTTTDKNGAKLICLADKAGKHRWQAA